MAPRLGEMTVKYDTESFNKLMKPVLDEINSQRRRIAELETTVAQLQKQLLRMADDGR